MRVKRKIDELRKIVKNAEIYDIITSKMIKFVNKNFTEKKFFCRNKIMIL